jgi:alginate O-acetyltransferase complex protein AlgI
MIFTEPRFFLFFLVVFTVYWLLPSNRSRKILLLVASYVFYGSWDYRFLSLLFASTTIDYLLGQRIFNEPRPEVKKRWVTVSVVANLGFLGFFKYFDFFTGSATAALDLIGIHASLPALKIILPAGISFYTFMSMSYTIDVYRGHPPAKSILDFALFVSFFPHLVAGPILRASQFLPQFDDKKRWRDVDARRALSTFLVGFVKKACIADNLAPLVDKYFAHPSQFGAQAAWIAVLCYAVQIYCDFSGYTDMAIGAAKLIGYELCKNFDAPYLSTSVTEFWRRWHISLSTWLRDYLYIPLGGNRGSKGRTYVNLMLTMLLGGLWHGAAWNFVAWGGMHGGALAFERAVGVGGGAGGRADRGGAPEPGPALRTVQLVLTFLWVCVAWIFFRSSGFDNALVTLRSFVLFRSPGTQALPSFLFGVLAVLAEIHWLGYRHRRAFAAAWQKLPALAFAPLYGVAFAVAVACVPTEHRPFIYFQF